VRLEEQLRNLGRGVDERQAPVSIDEIFDAGTSASSLDVSAAQPRSRWTWMATVAAGLLVLGGLGLIAQIGGDDQPLDVPTDSLLPGSVPTTIAEPATTPPTAPSTTDVEGGSEDRADVPPALEVDADAAGSVVGDVIEFDDFGQARINSVRSHAEARNELYGPPTPGTTLTEIEIERCAGTDQASVGFDMGGTRANGNLQNWTGVLDDGTEVPARPSYWLPYTAAPGGCARGYISVTVPDDAELVEVVARNLELVEISRWDVTRSRRSNPAEDPLRPSTPPDAVAVGEPMALEASSIEATVLDVIEDPTPKPSVVDLRDEVPAEPPEPGRKLVEIRAQVCKRIRPETEPTGPNPGPPDPNPQGHPVGSLNEYGWLIATEDNYIGNAGGEVLNGLDQWGDPDRRNSLWTGISSSLVVDPNSWLAGNTSLFPGECLDGYVQIDLPEDAVPVDVILTFAEPSYHELARTRLNS
jgi:hypothetical protein